MQPANLSNIEPKCAATAAASVCFVRLEEEQRPTVDTAAAAYYPSRRPQTLRGWACLENGPLRPIRISGRLHWKTEDIRRLLGVE